MSESVEFMRKSPDGILVIEHAQPREKLASFRQCPGGDHAGNIWRFSPSVDRPRVLAFLVSRATTVLVNEFDAGQLKR
jgi:hypothetical protein